MTAVERLHCLDRYRIDLCVDGGVVERLNVYKILILESKNRLL